MSALLKLLPVAAAAGVAVMNADALKKSLNVIGKVHVAATSGVEMQGIAEAVAMDFIETKDLPVENFGAFLKENLREKGGKETRDKSKDPWGTEYRLTVNVEKNGFTVLSAGPDKTWKTDDDLGYFYSLTGLAGKNAISADLASRAQKAGAASGSTSTAGGNTAATAKAGVATAKTSYTVAKPQPPSDETLRKNLESLTKRAEAGDAKASYDLAVKYIKGDGVERNLEKAKELLEKAAYNADSQYLKDTAKKELDKLLNSSQ